MSNSIWIWEVVLGKDNRFAPLWVSIAQFYFNFLDIYLYYNDISMRVNIWYFFFCFFHSKNTTEKYVTIFCHLFLTVVVDKIESGFIQWCNTIQEAWVEVAACLSSEGQVSLFWSVCWAKEESLISGIQSLFLVHIWYFFLLLLFLCFFLFYFSMLFHFH